uniref:Uncharacterized protein n=2 Tax=Lotus japonicus TaxID=34305 RepID=I3T5J6_LOTJA|nr:unknown [Lotus japonicus]
MVLNDLNLEGKETAGTCTTNDTKALEKEPTVVIPEGVSELLSVYITKECSNEDIPQLKDMSMLSDQNTTNVTSARRCNATSKEKNSEETEGQENSETTFKDNLTGDLSHEQETTDDTPTEKIVRAADTNKDPKLAPESIAEDQVTKITVMTQCSKWM